MLYDIPGRTGIPIHHRDAHRGSPSTRSIVAVKDAKGDLCASHPGHGRAPTCCGTPATTSLNLPLLAHGAPVCIVASSATSPATQYAAMVAAVDRRRPAAGAARSTPRSSRVDADHEHLPGRDHGQGRAASSSGVIDVGRRSALPLVEPPPTSARAGCATVSRQLQDSMSHPHPELDRPAAARRRAACASSPLGGLGEVGRNMTVFEYDGRLLIVDCGVLFPEDHHPGVDLILPDFEYITDRLDDVEALVLTHGHEDHIGAVPYLLRLERRHPARRLRADPRPARGQAAEHRIKPVHPQRAARGDREQLGAVRLRVRRGQPLHPRRARRRRSAPPAGTAAAHRRLQDGPAAARRPDHRPARVRPARRGGRRPLPDRLDQRRGPRVHHAREGHRPGARPGLPPARQQRIIVACFASHVHRVQQVLDAAVSPRPQGRHTSAARWCATWPSPRTSATSTCPPGVLVDVKELDDLPPTTSRARSPPARQGEPMAALSRIAQRNHQHRAHRARATPSSCASSLIPGNENAVYRVINGLMRARAPTSCTRATPWCTSPATPAPASCSTATTSSSRATCMPVHGEIRHLVANAELAVRHRRPARPAWCVAEDGVVVDLVDGRATIAGKVTCGYVFVDGSSVGDITEALLKDRRILRRGGLHLGDRGRRLGHRQGRRRPGDPRPRLRRGRRGLRRRQAADRSTRSTRPPPRASPTPTSSSRSSAASSGAGSTARTAAGR